MSFEPHAALVAEFLRDRPDISVTPETFPPFLAVGDSSVILGHGVWSDIERNSARY